MAVAPAVRQITAIRTVLEADGSSPGTEESGGAAVIVVPVVGAVTASVAEGGSDAVVEVGTVKVVEACVVGAVVAGGEPIDVVGTETAPFCFSERGRPSQGITGARFSKKSFFLTSGPTDE